MKSEDEKWLLIDGPLICSNPDHTMQSNGVQKCKGADGFFLFFFNVVLSVAFGEVYLISVVVQKVLADKSVIKADDAQQHVSRKWTEQWG